VQVFPHAAAAVLAVLPKQLLELLEQVRLGAEVAEAVVTIVERLGHLGLHLGAVVAVEAGTHPDQARFHLPNTDRRLDHPTAKQRPGTATVSTRTPKSPGNVMIDP
jgi:hypothetical protein